MYFLVEHATQDFLGLVISYLHLVGCISAVVHQLLNAYMLMYRYIPALLFVIIRQRRVNIHSFVSIA